MSVDLKPLHSGKGGELHRQFQAALNRRLRARGLTSYVVKEDGHTGPKTILAARKAAWALGALSSTYEAITKTGTISVGVQRMVRNPGRRTKRQLQIAEKRMTALRADRKRRITASAATAGGRLAVVRFCIQAANNYARNPGAYHYLAGGRANLEFLRATPRDWRSDCSQFASSVQNAAKLPDLGANGPLWVSTYTMAAYLDETTHPSPGDFGMYGSRSAPHHVEVYCAAPGHEFIGHGSPPIDSLTPGRPDFYLKNPIK